ncbi:ATP-binding cassette domain-containing protein [uncultured Cloacibacillus sp.]|uniref:ATP-binding cassette domain-containing protein n=1 Tax=uncultured Cloacibacillus sp. TaxID=889794 RepID=UPI0026DB7FE3|nr:ATP-binding cassette domain-containing protein [uncultured Cloacibacillus sp.]
MCREPQFILKGAEFAYANAAEKILRGIDLEIRAGEWVALLGSNGSGKSTLLKILSALLTPTQGFCFVCGLDTREAKPEQLRGISSIVFQNPEDQIVAAVVEEEAAFGPENLGCHTEEICRRVEASLKATGLWERRRDLVSSLSGGQKQRLALAGALAMHPRAILLDEALSMLDPRSRLEFTEIIKREHGKGVTIVEVTHRLEEIRCAERVIVLDRGKVSCDMPVHAFLNKSAAELASMHLMKPPIECLAEKLRAEGYLPDGCVSDAESLKTELCRLL